MTVVVFFYFHAYFLYDFQKQLELHEPPRVKKMYFRAIFFLNNRIPVDLISLPRVCGTQRDQITEQYIFSCGVTINSVALNSQYFYTNTLLHKSLSLKFCNCNSMQLFKSRVLLQNFFRRNELLHVGICNLFA